MQRAAMRLLPRSLLITPLALARPLSRPLLAASAAPPWQREVCEECARALICLRPPCPPHLTALLTPAFLSAPRVCQASWRE